MIGVLRTKFLLTARKPWTLIILTVLIMVFAFFLGRGTYVNMMIPVFSEISEEASIELINELNGSELFDFELVDEQEMRDAVQGGNTEAGLHIRESDYSLIVTADTGNTPVLNHFVQKVYSNKLQKDQIISSLTSDEEKAEVEELWEQSFEEPFFEVKKESFRDSETKVIDMPLQSIFGFSLFFVIYTISSNVISMLEERKNLIWDRMIVSSIKKWEMYAGNLLYSFIIGYAQIVLIFLTYQYVAGIDFYGGFGKTLIVLIPYVLTIVALSMLVVSLSKSTGQYNAFIPILSVSMAMIGGAYWPLEIVTSDVMLFLSNFSPIFYGMEALKGATIYGSSFGELLQPMSILLLMAVLMMGIGINIMELRKK